MTKEIQRYFRYMFIAYKYNFQSLSIYRANYLAGIVMQFGQMLTQLFFFYITVNKIGRLGKYDSGTVLAIYGFFMMISLTYNMLAGRITEVPEELAFNGGLDKYLIKPYSVLFQLTFGNIQVAFIPTIFASFLIFIWGTIKANITINVFFWLRFGIAYICSILLLSSIYITFCCFGFWVNDRLSIQMPMNQLLQMARYPTDIYNKQVAFLLMWGIPLAFVGFFPVLFIFMDDQLKSTYSLLPLISIFWFVLALIFWKKGLHRYASVS